MPLDHEGERRLRDQLTLHEGLQLQPYIDTVGKITIGVGRNLDDKGISEAEAQYLLFNDMEEVKKSLSIALPWTAQLDEIRYRVIFDMCFNLGITRLLQFKNTLAAVKRGDYTEAASLMLQSKWAIQVRKRATRLAAMMRSGQDYSV